MILIVDDDPSVRRLVELRLSSRGFPTKSAGNAKEAMQILHSGIRPCLLLLDIMMPGKTGWEFADMLLKEPLLSTIPIKFMSANPLAIEKYIASGGSRISLLPKPLDSSRLLSAAEAHCKHRSAGAAK